MFLELKSAKIDELLNFMNKPHYLNGDLTINANIRNIDNNNLDGKLIANISKGQLENDVINKEFKQTFSSKINIDGDIEASFLGKNAEIKTQLLTSIGNLILEKTLVDLEKDTYRCEVSVNNITSLSISKDNFDLLHLNSLMKNKEIQLCLYLFL